MTVENATLIGELDPTNPPGSDFFSQGDNHLVLLKSVLQSQFPGLVTGAAITGRPETGTTGEVVALLEEFNRIPRAIIADYVSNPVMSVPLVSSVIGADGLAWAGTGQVLADVANDGATLPDSDKAAFAGTIKDLAGTGQHYGLWLEGQVQTSAGISGVSALVSTLGAGGGIGVDGTARGDTSASGVVYGVRAHGVRGGLNNATVAGLLAQISTEVNATTVGTWGVLIDNNTPDYPGLQSNSLTIGLQVQGTGTSDLGKWDYGAIVRDVKDNGVGLWVSTPETTFTGTGLLIDTTAPNVPSPLAGDRAPLVIRSGDAATSQPERDYGLLVNGWFERAAIRILDEQRIQFNIPGGSPGNLLAMSMRYRRVGSQDRLEFVRGDTVVCHINMSKTPVGGSLN